jgi:hypothetical protein
VTTVACEDKGSFVRGEWRVGWSEETTYLDEVVECQSVFGVRR